MKKMPPLLALPCSDLFQLSAQQLPLITQHQQYFTIIHPAAMTADYFSENRLRYTPTFKAKVALEALKS